ncbi:MAG: hypothetical protein KBT47_07500 [Armatimonadetes bacterium]|nr:hypothetical protein [Candidatus Hippobium faecium]
MIEDWDKDIHKIKFSEDNVYFWKINEITDVFLEAGEGKFYTGITDLHPGGDGICAFRDPENMNFDLIDYPDEIKNALNKIQPVLYRVYDYFYNKLKNMGQACCTWHTIASNKRFYIPSNDFSCMISNKMFREFFLDGIIEECRFYENSIYHLDGPGALQMIYLI